MNLGYFNYPMPANEPVRNYAPGSPEKIALKKALSELKSVEHDIPAFIGGKEIRSGNKVIIRPPHELSHTLGYFHRSTREHVELAIAAALEAKPSWESMNWENRAAIFLKAADLLAGKYRGLINGATMLGQSKNAYQAEIDSACELIDFLRFNVHFVSQIYKQQPLSGAGVHNRMEYRLEEIERSIPFQQIYIDISNDIVDEVDDTERLKDIENKGIIWVKHMLELELHTIKQAIDLLFKSEPFCKHPEMKPNLYKYFEL